MSKRSFRMWADDKPQYDEDDLPRSRRVAHYDPVGEALAITAELRELKKLARELANWIESRMIDVGGAAGFYCMVCDSGVGGRMVTKNDIAHNGDCLIARARRAGLLEN